MSALDTVLSVGDGTIVGQLAGQLGIEPEKARSSLSALLPALASGVQEKLARGEGAGLSQLINSGSLAKFADNPSNLATPDAVEHGKNLLEHIFESQNLSGLTDAVAEKAGVSHDVITRVLPLGATLLGGLLSRTSASGGSVADAVSEFSDSSHHGFLDAVKSLAGKIFH